MWYKNWSNAIILLMLFFVFTPYIRAQKGYGTTNGIINIMGVFNDSVLVAKSNELLVILNYKTAEFEMKLDKSTLKTGVDSLDKKLAYMEDDFITYRGRLGIEYIQTEKHKTLDFFVEGYITNDTNNKI